LFRRATDRGRPVCLPGRAEGEHAGSPSATIPPTLDRGRPVCLPSARKPAKHEAKQKSEIRRSYHLDNLG